MKAPRSAGFLLTAEDTGRVLLMLRSLDSSSPATWDTPGGQIDEGETPREAALRELDEETGYTGGVYIHGGEFQRKRYLLILASVPEEFDIDVSDEHIDAGWFEPGDPPRPLHRDLADVLAEVAR